MDLSVFDKIKSINDYQQDYSAKRQALATGSLDQLSKQNVYATQVLSGASATGDQAAYDAARRHLADNGVDLSAWAPDVQTGAKQAAAARLAQSPLGSLLNAGLKEQSNAIQLAPLTGQISPTAAGQGGILGALGGGGALPAPQPAPQWNNPDRPAITPQAPTMPPATQSNNAPVATPSGAPQQGGFTPPSQMLGEPVPTYRARVEQAFQQYKETPETVRSKEAASNQGKTDAANLEASNKAQELTDRLTKNLQAMLKLNDSVPQSGFVPVGAKAYLSRGLQANKGGIIGDVANFVGADTSGNTATAYDQWNQINNQQVLSEIQQFVASGGANVRVNQTLEKIAQAASNIHPESSPPSRKVQIMNALAELQNKNISGKNLVNANNGQPAAPYTDLPVTVPEEKIPTDGNLSGAEKALNDTGINTTAPQKGEVRGGYLFMGGNPNDKNNYKKVGK